MDHTEKMVGMAHPIGQALTEVTMAQLAAGAAPPIAPGRSFKENELKQRFSSDYSIEYISGVSDYLHTQICMFVANSVYYQS